MEDRVEDLLEAGVLDPAKVTRSGLQNACGIAGIMLTTQVRLQASFQKLLQVCIIDLKPRYTHSPMERITGYQAVMQISCASFKVGQPLSS